MNKYAVIPTEHFNREALTETYLVISERENYVVLEYTTQANPTGEHWVIFEGEGANIRCADYMDPRGW